MLKLKLQYFKHLMQRANSLGKTLMLGKIEGRRGRGQLRMRWLDGITDSMDVSLGLIFLSSVFPSIRVFPNESALHIRWPNYWSFSLASAFPMNIQG